MPKYWGKQIFTHGRFPEVGQKQKTVITMAKLRMAHASTPKLFSMVIYKYVTGKFILTYEGENIMIAYMYFPSCHNPLQWPACPPHSSGQEDRLVGSRNCMKLLFSTEPEKRGGL